MEIERKSLPFFSIPTEAKTDGSASRKVAGIAAVFGNVDVYDDVILPGAFKNTIEREFKSENAVRHLWQHSFFDPPTAVVTDLKEVTREELPPAVLEKAPEATGGLFIEREYLEDPESDRIFRAVQKGALNQMSFGFDAIKKIEKTSVDQATGIEKTIRFLEEVKLYDTSDVLWGANSATVATDAKDLNGLLQKLFISLKAGARNRATDLKTINQIHALTIELGSTTCKGIVGEDDEEEDAKSAAGILAKNRAALRRLNFEFLRIGS